MRGRTVTALLVLLAARAPSAAGQSLMLQGIAAHSDHELFGSVGGLGVAAGARLGRGDAFLRFQLSRITGTERRTGIACAGLIWPGTCFEEPLSDHAGMTTGGLTVSLPVARRGAVKLAFITGISLTDASSLTRGLSSGQQLGASKVMGGIEGGLETAISPRASLPFSIVVGGSLSRLSPMRRDDVVDGYTPLEYSSTLSRLWLGIAWFRK